MGIRVLCLPGFGQNAITFHRKFAAVQKQCKGVDFVIADPPHILLQAHDPSDASASQPPSEPITADSPPELIPRAWWTANEDKTIYYNLDPTLVYIKTLLEKQEVPFDGVLGFSQGAAMAALLVALLERPDDLPSAKINHPPMRFGVFVSGFKPLDLSISRIFEKPITTPTVHALGKTDVIVSIKRSQTLIDACQAPRVEWHEGGHHIPSKASWRAFFKTYLAAWDTESTTSPSEVPSPTPPHLASGTSTPAETPLGAAPEGMLLTEAALKNAEVKMVSSL
ncbi:hypothetical protein DL93DRAFT_2073927 [Clavulina sp. PMI_390]|nr:hypothetical protein DL93DRAFT_2073927 [Clavulina sp. PMI_390]